MSDEIPPSDGSPPPVEARPVALAQLARPAPAVSDLEMPGVSRRDAWLDVVVVLLACIVVPYLPALVAVPEPEGAVQVNIDALVLQTWYQAALATGLLLYFVLRHRLRPSMFGLRRARIGPQMLWGLAGLGGVYVGWFVGVVIVLAVCLIFPAAEPDLAARKETLEAMPVHNLLTTLVLLVAVAIHEETVFRGLLLPYLRRALGSWWPAVLISAVIFAALHIPNQGILGGVQVLGIGVVLAIVFILSRSLLAVMLAHLLFDFGQFQLIRFLLPNLEELFKHV